MTNILEQRYNEAVAAMTSARTKAQSPTATQAYRDRMNAKADRHRLEALAIARVTAR